MHDIVVSFLALDLRLLMAIEMHSSFRLTESVHGEPLDSHDSQWILTVPRYHCAFL